MSDIKPDCTFCASPLKNYRFKVQQDLSDPDLDECLTWQIVAFKRDNINSGYVVIGLCSEKEAELLSEAMNKVVDAICG